jgi:hypothetical protein
MPADPVEIALLLIGSLGPMFLLFHTLAARNWVYATWAKFAYLLATLAGLAWAIIGFVVLRPSHFTPRSLSLLLPAKYVCAGMVIAFLLSVLIARPCHKRSTTHASADVSQHV